MGMKTAQERDAMAARVQEAAAKWPTFKEMPVTDETLVLNVEVKGDPAIQANYVAALYECSFAGATPIGRRRNARVIVGVTPPPAEKLPT